MQTITSTSLFTIRTKANNADTVFCSAACFCVHKLFYSNLLYTHRKLTYMHVCENTSNAHTSGAYTPTAAKWLPSRVTATWLQAVRNSKSCTSYRKGRKLHYAESRKSVEKHIERERAVEQRENENGRETKRWKRILLPLLPNLPVCSANHQTLHALSASVCAKQSLRGAFALRVAIAATIYYHCTYAYTH